MAWKVTVAQDVGLRLLDRDVEDGSSTAAVAQLKAGDRQCRVVTLAPMPRLELARHALSDKEREKTRISPEEGGAEEAIDEGSDGAEGHSGSGR
jgi:hypothetical protein